MIEAVEGGDTKWRQLIGSAAGSRQACLRAIEPHDLPDQPVNVLKQFCLAVAACLPSPPNIGLSIKPCRERTEHASTTSLDSCPSRWWISRFLSLVLEKYSSKFVNSNPHFYMDISSPDAQLTHSGVCHSYALWYLLSCCTLAEADLVTMR